MRRETGLVRRQAARLVIFIVGLALVAACRGSPAKHVAQPGPSTTLRSAAPHRQAWALKPPRSLLLAACGRAGYRTSRAPIPAGNFPMPSCLNWQPVMPVTRQRERPVRTCSPMAAYPPRPSCSRQRRKHWNFPSACAGTASPTSRARAATAVYPTRRRSGSTRARPSSRRQTKPAGSTGRPPYMPSNAAYDAWARTSTS